MRYFYLFLILLGYSVLMLTFFSSNIRTAWINLSQGGTPDENANTTNLHNNHTVSETLVNDTSVEKGLDDGTTMTESLNGKSTRTQPVRNESTELKNLEERYKKRRMLLYNQCDKYRTHPDWPKLSISEGNRGLRLTINSNKKILWARVPKCATTTWKTFLLYCGNKKTRKEDSKLVESFKNKTTKSLLDFWEDARQKGYISFTFVRHPFARVLSAFKNRVEGPNSPQKGFCNMLAKKYGFIKGTENTISVCKFSHFVQDMIDRQNFFYHWEQMYKVTRPCNLYYDVIGKMETFEEDAKYILSKIKLNRGVKNKKNSSGKTDNAKYFSTLTKKQLLGLYKIYKIDLDLFGYDYKEYLPYVKD